MTSVARGARSRIYDALYGEIEIADALAELAQTAAVQRLRRVRLSNIDSIDSPGIAGVSRFEHVLGTAHLARSLAFWSELDDSEQLSLAASALLHDIAITPFGHLLEEALRYAGVSYSHEKKMAALFGDPETRELGGIDLQLYLGFESGISPWAQKSFGANAKQMLRVVLDAVNGVGRFGPCISGQIDLDNLDNVVRLSHHMGIATCADLAHQIAGCMIGIDDGGLIWDSGAPSAVSAWLELREQLYTRLMFAKSDFIGKAMLTAAIVAAHSNGQLGTVGYEWTMTDDQLLQCLRTPTSGAQRRQDATWISETVKSWEVGRLWSITPFWWVDGDMPSQERIWAFRKVCSSAAGRECYAHGIADKRHRAVRIRFQNGSSVQVGAGPTKWLLGVVSPRREDFTRKEAGQVADAAAEYFGRQLISFQLDQSGDRNVPSLFDW